MKILIITQIVDINDPVLGFFHSWIKEFSKNYKNVTVVCLKKGQNELPQNVKVLSLGKESGVSRIKYIFNFYKYIFKESRNYDFVFVHMNPVYIILGGLFWKIMNKKIGLWYTHKSKNIQLRVAEKISDIVFSASKESFRIKSKKLNVMGHGIDITTFESNTGSIQSKKLLSLGRISPIKDIETCIMAIKNLNEQGFDFSLDIIGGPINKEDFKYLEEMKSKAITLNLQEKIKFLGTVKNSELPEFFKNYFGLLHTSNTGSLDKVVLESMLSGIFVFSSNEATNSITKDNPFFSFEKGNYFQLAQNIIKVYGLQNEEKVRLSNVYQNIVKEKHGLESLIKRISFIYEQ